MKTELINEDALKVLRENDELENSVDVVVTSPPYNLGKKYGDGVSDKRRPSEYLNWMDDWLRALRRVVKEDGSVFLNIGGPPSDQTLPLRVMAVAQESWNVQNVIHWVKSIALPQEGGDRTYGHFKPINSPRYLNDTHEYIFHLTHHGKTPLDRKAPGVGVAYTDKSNVGRWGHTGGSDLRCRGNVWFMPYETIQSRDKQRPHPATFPVQLAQRCISLHGNVEDAHVMDPFLGIGSSLRAAFRCGAARFTGVDVVEGYVKEALARLGQEEEERGQQEEPA